MSRYEEAKAIYKTLGTPTVDTKPAHRTDILQPSRLCHPFEPTKHHIPPIKIILNKKRFDCTNGEQASPILPDGTLLSLPIPSHDNISFSEIRWKGTSFCDIIRQLNEKTFINSNSHCHLDPDLRKEVRQRKQGWMPAFGQKGSPLTELYNNDIGTGDIFLYYGWFRRRGCVFF